MGSADGGLSQPIALTLNREVTIQLPSGIDASLMDSVILYNFSPYLIQVNMGVNNTGWLGSFMADKFKIGNTNSFNIIPVSIVGQNPSAPVLVNTLTAAFVTVGAKDENVGTYPVALLSNGGTVQANEVLITDSNGNDVGIWNQNELTILNPTNNADSIIVTPSDPISGALWPTISFNVAGQARAAFINSTASPSNNPTLGLNAGEYNSDYGTTLYPRIFMYQKEIDIHHVTVGQEAFGGGIQVFDNGLSLNVINSGGATISRIWLQDGGFIVVLGQMIYEVWNAINFTNPNWGVLGSGFGTPQYRKTIDGKVEFSGCFQWNDGVTAPPIAVMTLPVGYRPNRTVHLTCWTMPNANTTPTPETLEIATTGTVTLTNYPGASGPFSPINLEGLRFDITA